MNIFLLAAVVLVRPLLINVFSFAPSAVPHRSFVRLVFLGALGDFRSDDDSTCVVLGLLSYPTFKRPTETREC